ncbi:hypothetical protein [Holospora curviuscula]|uniref:hypothetical protein n=1 Tax=Holospora curviuscula TaxID=1082868 RepID=UPI0013FD6530|nr:hypothetical protein [Holospora curviuscula]
MTSAFTHRLPIFSLMEKSIVHDTTPFVFFPSHHESPNNTFPSKNSSASVAYPGTFL